MRPTLKATVLAIALLLGACGGAEQASIGPQRAEIPVPGAPRSGPGKGPAREQPPGPLASKEAPFPKSTRTKLANGLEVVTIEAHALPIVQVRVVVAAGNGYGGLPAVPKLTAELLKDGGTRTMTSAELLRRIESLGADLGVDVDFDSSRVALGVTKDHFESALALVAEMVQSPAFDEKELAKLKARASDEAADNARSNGTWMATRALFRELFAAQNPYASFDATPSEIARVNGLGVREFHKRFYVPKNTSVFVVGDVDSASAAKTVEKAFGAWKGGDAPKTDFPPAIPIARRRVLLVNRPKSTQSDVFVASLTVPRKAPDWPAIRVSNQILGGVPAGRLFLDVREQRSLAYATVSRITELANGDQPLIVYVGTQTPKTAAAVQGVLEDMDRMKSITAEETASARRYLSDVFALRMETLGNIADLAVQLDVLGLPDGYYDRYREELRATDASGAMAAAQKMFHPDRCLIVVAGDADVIAAPLSRFGEVTVLDAEHDFQSVRTLPFDANAKE